MSKEKNVYNLLKILDNVNNNKTFNLFNKNKIKIKESFIFSKSFLKNFLVSCYFFTIVFFLYTNYNYFAENNYKISIIESIYLVFAFASIIIYWFIFDFISYFLKKYFTLKYNYLIDNFKKKEKTYIIDLIGDVDFLEELNLKNIVENKLEQYNSEDNEIISKVIKQTSFKSENENLNIFVSDILVFNKEINLE
jgi:hypothetical protein